MKKKELQEQLATKKRRAYYTMTYTGDDATQVVNFEGQAKKGGSKTMAKLVWITILAVAAYLALKHFL